MASFSQRHYEAIAEVLRVEHDSIVEELGRIGRTGLHTNRAENWLVEWRQIRDDLCAMFARDNPRFKQARFMKACGTELA